MTSASKAANPPIAVESHWLEEILECLRTDRGVRKDLGDGGRLHIDRALPFLCIHITRGREDLVARDIAAAHASYLIARDDEQARGIIAAVGSWLCERFGAFMLLDIDEIERDRLIGSDAPFLPPFEIRIAATGEASAQAAADALADGVDTREVKFRTPQVERFELSEARQSAFLVQHAGFPAVVLRFAPIYRQPGTEAVYPDLRQRLIANIFDAGLKAFAAFVEMTQSLKLTSHRALGRQAFVDAVSRADRGIDEVASTFDFLLAVTPINASAAWHEFKAGGFKQTPRFLYRPLAVQVQAEKKKLFSIAFDHFEDPVLDHLYREKQEELDLQLTLISARETARFVELSRALYGPVEPALLEVAVDILAQTATHAEESDEGNAPKDTVDCRVVETAARTMIAGYRDVYPDFTARVELRDDLPSGLLVSGDRLLISTSTVMAAHRLEALLSHEIGVHLLTYFNGSAQGLRLFRSGLAGYEGMQEGLAVFSEYMAGGMTVARLRLIAARVVACASMLSGATFVDNFRALVRDHGFQPAAAFNLVLRLYRGGGLAKDAIYLRGLLELLRHLKAGGALDPFWMGKIASAHFGVMQELAMRGLLKAPAVRPAFLTHPDAQARLDKARAGLSPLDMIRN